MPVAGEINKIPDLVGSGRSGPAHSVTGHRSALGPLFPRDVLLHPLFPGNLSTNQNPRPRKGKVQDRYPRLSYFCRNEPPSGAGRQAHRGPGEHQSRGRLAPNLCRFWSPAASLDGLSSDPRSTSRLAPRVPAWATATVKHHSSLPQCGVRFSAIPTRQANDSEGTASATNLGSAIQRRDVI